MIIANADFFQNNSKDSEPLQNMCYSKIVMRQTACMVINQIIVITLLPSLIARIRRVLD